MDNTTAETTVHIYQPEFHVIEEYVDIYDSTLYTLPLFSSCLGESSLDILPQITATNPYEALDKTKQAISNLMEENGYLYLDETLTSVTFDSEETGEIIRVFNIRLQIIE